MIVLRTGLPGASKTLSTISELCSNVDFHETVHYYHNIKYFSLDLVAVSSFGYWLTAIYLHTLDDAKSIKKRISAIHQAEMLCQLSDFPELDKQYNAWLLLDGPKTEYLKWSKVAFSKSTNLQKMLDYVSENPACSLDDLKQFGLHWLYLDTPENWYLCQHPSLIVLDECQRHFSPRPVGSKAPRHVSEFETHRHLGTDVHLITQDSKLLDSNIRRLAGRHVHYVNLLGSKRVRRMEMPSAFDPSNYFDSKQADKSIVKHPTKFYGIYLSALTHTHKLKMPAKAFLLPVMLVATLILFYLLFTRLTNSSNSTQTQKSDISPSMQSLAPEPPSLGYFELEELKLRSACKQLTFAGFNRVGSDVIAYFNCESDEDVNVSIQRNEEEPFSYTYKSSKLLDAASLARFGISAQIVDNALFLRRDKEMYFVTFFDKKTFF